MLHIASGEQYPAQSMPSLSSFNFATPQTFLPELPPTPVSPFRPLRPLSEEERLAFPCLGGPQDCWNIQLCPKHREYPGTSRKSSTSTNSPSVLSDSSTRSLPTESSSSDSATDFEGRAKLKRNATHPGINANTNNIKKAHASTTRPVSGPQRPLSRGRVPHNLVERRYRDNLNAQIESLRMTLPSLRDLQPSSDYDDSNPRIPSKAVIIQTATSYIQDLRNERDRLSDANKALQDQVSTLQKLLGDSGSVLQYVNAMRATTGNGGH